MIFRTRKKNIRIISVIEFGQKFGTNSENDIQKY